MGGRTWDKGYISVLRLKPDRFIFYREHLNYGVAVCDNEAGVLAFISPQEIIAQIPVVDIISSIPIGDLDSDSNIFFEKYKDVLLADKYRFAAKSIFLLHCPRCRGELYCYLSECIGTYDSQLVIYTPQKSVQKTGRLAINSGQDSEYMLRELTFQGKIVKCMHCGTYLYNPQLANRIPLKMVEVWLKGSRLFFELKNRTDDFIDAISVRVAYEQEGRLEERNYQSLLINWYPLDPIKWECDPFWDARIRPWSSVVHEIELDQTICTKKIYGVRIVWVHFEDGRTWVPWDAFESAQEFWQGRPSPCTSRCLASLSLAEARAVSAPSKLGASYGVQVPIGKGLTTHPYRVLQLWRRLRD